MKLTALNSILAIFISLSAPEGITISGSSTNNIEISVSEKIEKSEFVLTNNTDKTINLRWERKTNTLVKGWDYSVCAYGRCSVGVPESGQFRVIKPSESGFFALHLFPKGVTGTGKLEIEVFDANQPKSRQLLVFNVSVVE